MSAVAARRARAWLALGVALGLLPAAGAGRASIGPGSPLSLTRLLPGETPRTTLAQRAIVRAWGPADEPLWAKQRQLGWRSEPLAVALSAVVPGAGQAYVGDGGGMWFAVAEVAGWTAHYLYVRDSDRRLKDAARRLGNPSDSTSAWSYARWLAAAPEGDISGLEALWAADRSGFYEAVARDPRYFAGWGGSDPARARADFQHLRDLSAGALARARHTEVALWLNHLLAAVDALRAARDHNLPIRRNLDLQVRSSWRGHAPVLSAALLRRF